MIGIDLTRISRFESINLDRFGKKIGHQLDSPKTAAKTWACLEAITKAEGKSFGFSKIKIMFPKNNRPTVVDTSKVLSGNYILSLSHEGDYVTAIALRQE
jgi:phosphopantetheinyl transferase (holo-ACP synthase)